MNASVPPVRPVDFALLSLRELLDLWHGHTAVIFADRHQLADPLPVDQLAEHALEALAAGQALADQLNAMRWVGACEALAYGAPLDDVAAALNLEVDEVVIGLGSWADRQLRHGLMTPARHDEVLALLEVSR